jgi:LacI family transcriptional regulator
MTRRKRVTISQVAREAGVSTQTVSRVLNDRPDVSPATRRRVKEVIERLGYRPSHAARALSQGLSGSIGVVAYGIEYFGPSRALSGVEKQASELGYTPLLYLLREPQTENVSQILEDLLARHVDGIIWAVPEIGNNRAWLDKRIPDFPVPLVFLSMDPRPDTSVVCVDNYRGGKLATGHLINQGYREIGLITGPMDWWEVRERARGWRDALVEAGIVPDGSLVVNGDWTAESGERGMSRLLDQRPGLDAVFAANDQMALGAIQAARKRGLHLPQDLAIAGFDDMPEAAYLWPPLTTISHPLFDVGCLAVKELQRLLAELREGLSEIQPRTIVLQPNLVIRESSKSKPKSE